MLPYQCRVGMDDVGSLDSPLSDFKLLLNFPEKMPWWDVNEIKDPNKNLF